MLDFNQSSQIKIQQLQAHLQCLSEFSRLSLVESQTKKDHYLIDCLDLFHNLSINSINGGFYQKFDNKLELSLENNRLLAEFLFAGGLTFFNGELNYQATNTLSAIINNLYNPDKKLFHSSLSYSLSDAPFIFTKKTLSEILNNEELILLYALLGVTHSDNTAYWINFRNSLSKAAEILDIHQKKLQILEHGLRLKLIRYQTTRPSDYSLSDNFCLSHNAAMLCLLIQTVVRDRQKQHMDLITDLKNSLLETISNDLKMSHTHTIDICLALLDFCQIQFEPAIINLAVKKISMLRDIQTLTETDKNKLGLIYSYLAQILETDVQINKLQLTYCGPGFQKIEVVKLTGSNIQQQRSLDLLLDNYNPLLRIIRINSNE